MQFTIHQGDCIDVMRSMPERSIDLVLCDLPYGTTTCAWDVIIPFDAMWDGYKRVLKPDGAVVLFGSQPFTSKLVVSNLSWFRHELIWDKNKCGSPGLAKYRPMKVHENILVFSPKSHVYNPIMEPGEPYKRDPAKRVRCNNHGYAFSGHEGVDNPGVRYPKSIRQVSRDFSAQQQIHPTQKPVPLLNWLIRTYSNPRAKVLDNAMGSGSTGVACAETDRDFVGIEKDGGDFQTAKLRIAAAYFDAEMDGSEL